MANFWDLPKPVREKIYRLHLVQEDPLGFDDFTAAWGRRYLGQRNEDSMPKLLQVCDWAERQTAEMIYWGENIFFLEILSHVELMRQCLWPRHIRLIRHLSFGGWDRPWKHGLGYNNDLKQLGFFTRLETLTLRIDEQMALEHHLECHPNIKWHKSLGTGTQLQLQTLNFCGIQGLKTLRDIRHIDFPPDTKWARDNFGGFGAIPGGVLDTTIRREIMQSSRDPPYKPAGHFRFLDLPPEVRNMVYSLLLVFTGPTYPKAGKPTSVTCQYPWMSTSKREKIPVPHTALAILQTNHQINREAAGIFYHQNDLVFSFPSHLQAFICNLETGRLDNVSNITLFHKNHNEGGVNTMDLTLNLVRRMRGLKKLHILLEHHMIRTSWRTFPQSRKRSPGCIHGVSTLFSFRGIVDIKIRDLDLEKLPYDHMDKKSAEDQVQVLKHFNYGLALAQQGNVVKELYEDTKWFQEEHWPSLGEAKCGSQVGCLCGGTADEEPSKED